MYLIMLKLIGLNSESILVCLLWEEAQYNSGKVCRNILSTEECQNDFQPIMLDNVQALLKH